MSLRKLSSAEVREILANGPAPRGSDAAPSGPEWAYREAAAVVPWFVPSHLRPFGEALPDDAFAILHADVVDAPEPDAWMLRGEVRAEALRRLAARGALRDAARATPPPPDSDGLAVMYRAVLLGERPSLDELDEPALSHLLQVVLWTQEVLDDLPTADKVRQRLDRQRLLTPFLALAGRHFHGREDDLADLRDHVGVLPPDSLGRRIRRATRSANATRPMTIEGPGGIGKSTLIARFILDHARLLSKEPLAFVHLDFDDPGLHADDWRTWLREGIRQLQVQVASETGGIGAASEEFQAAVDRVVPMLEPRPGARDLPEPEAVRGFAEATRIAASGGASEPDPRLLFVLDTFEEFEIAGPSLILGLSRLLTQLARAHPGLRAVISGRTEPELPNLKLRRHRLRPLEPEAARAYLTDRGLSPDLARKVESRLGGNPLTLRLAASVLRDDPASRDWVTGLDTGPFWRKVTEARIQGELYHRVIAHVDRSVQGLALAGLVLRRIDPGVIEHVLLPATPEASGHTATELYALLSRERSLLFGSGGVLRLRTDVRRSALGLLEARDPELVRTVDEAAAAYYATDSTAEGRAEELYHLMRLGRPVRELDARWLDAAGPFLGSVLPELGPAERSWLAGQLRAEVDEDTRRAADVVTWERQAAAAARDLLEVHEAGAALARLSERKERSERSPLYLFDAWALTELGRLGEARRAIDRGLAKTVETEDTEQEIGLYILASRLSREQGDLDAAAEHLAAASAATAGGTRALRVELEQIAVARDRRDAAQIARLQAELSQRFAATPDSALLFDRDLVRRCAAEIGAHDPQGLARALRIAGLGNLSMDQRAELIGGLTAAGDDVVDVHETYASTFELAPGTEWAEVIRNAELAGRLDELVGQALASASGNDELRTSIADAASPPDEPEPPLPALL